MPAISVFVSYARADDEATYRRITRLKKDIQLAYSALNGESVGVFQDVESIELGDNWRDRIRAGLTSSSIFLAFVSPAFLRSTACREEAREFLGILRSSRNERLVIPLIFGDMSRLKSRFADDDLWGELSSLQALPTGALRSAEPGSSVWMSNVHEIAERIELELSRSH